MTIYSAAPPTAVHIGEEDLPFVDMGDGSTLQVLQVDLASGVWVIRTQFQPGAAVQKHKHTGIVYAFTQSGSWHYLETPEAVNTAGSYLFEPAGSVHTLNVPASNTEVTDVWFVIYGANLNLDANDNIEIVIDAQSVYDFYKIACKDQFGIDDPPVVMIDSH
ncbi:MAG: cupin [Actinobacteria bacterium]|nr:cupin [Actinomycetota bacterium]